MRVQGDPHTAGLLNYALLFHHIKRRDPRAAPQVHVLHLSTVTKGDGVGPVGSTPSSPPLPTPITDPRVAPQVQVLHVALCGYRQGLRGVEPGLRPRVGPRRQRGLLVHPAENARELPRLLLVRHQAARLGPRSRLHDPLKDGHQAGIYICR